MKILSIKHFKYIYVYIYLILYSYYIIIIDLYYININVIISFDNAFLLKLVWTMLHVINFEQKIEEK